MGSFRENKVIKIVTSPAGCVGPTGHRERLRCAPSPGFVLPPTLGSMSMMNYLLLPSLHNEVLLCLYLASTSGSWHF